MKTFRSYIKENMLDSDREVNYYNSLAKEKMKLMGPPKEPEYQKAFLGKVTSSKNLIEATLPVPNGIEVSDKIHNPDDFLTLDRDEGPNRGDVEDTHQFLLDHVSSIPHEQRHIDAVKAYTDQAYTDVNNYLYGNTPRLKYEDNSDHIDNLKDIISKSTMPKALTLFTGIKRNPSDYKVENGMIHMIMPAFTSTSLAHSEARSFASPFPRLDDKGKPIVNRYGSLVKNMNVIRLNVPEGSHAYYMDAHSRNDGEKEVLLHPNAKIKLWPKPSLYVDPYGQTVVLNHWYGRLVHDGIKELPIPETDPYHPKNLGI